MKRLKFVDLFCGIGGFHIAAASLDMKCVYACDNDHDASRTYMKNFDHWPWADIKNVKADDIPNHDILFAGFPCQPFSIIGNRKGLEHKQGNLLFEIIRILNAKRPKMFLLENVKQFANDLNGETLKWMVKTLRGLGYQVEWKVLNSLDFGLPQKRERIFIVGSQLKRFKMNWPENWVTKQKHLREILEPFPDEKYFASAKIKKKRFTAHQSSHNLAIWHENKSGIVTSHPYSCALRASASHNYLLVNGERRLTPREMLRLQGFPETFKIVSSDAQVKKQVGNAVSIPVVTAILKKLVNR